MRRVIHIDDFSGGLVTNADKGDLKLNTAETLKNIRIDQPGKMRGVPGNVKAFDLPSTIEGDVRWFQEVVINNTQVMIIWGLDSNSIQHFYYATDGTGTAWIEITEFVAVEVLVRTSDTVFTIQAGTDPFDDTPSTINDTYNNWYLFYRDASNSVNNTVDLITDYTGSTATVTVLNGISSAAANDQIILMRFPLWEFGHLEDLADSTLSNFNDHRNFVRDAANSKPSILQRRDAVAIINGRKKANLNVDFKSDANIWFGFVTTGNMFDHSALSLTDYHAERKVLSHPNAAMTGQIVINTNTDDPLPDADWVVNFSFVYDGFQDSGLDRWFPSLSLYQRMPANPFAVTTSGGNDEIQAPLSWDRFPTETEMNESIASRRITAIRMWAAQAELIGGTTWKAATPWFLVKEIAIKATDWSGTGPYTVTLTFTGSDWTAGQANEFKSITGHFDPGSLYSFGDFGAKVSGREIIGSIGINFDENNSITEGDNFLVASVINAALRNAFDALPTGKIVSMEDSGIYKINVLENVSELLAVFGENNLVLMEFDFNGNLVPRETFKEVGVSGFWSTDSDGKALRWGNQRSIYEIQRQGAPVEIGFPIRNEWQALSATNRKTSIAVHDKEKSLFILHTQAEKTYIYDTIQKNWYTYDSASVWEWLSVGIDGEVFATDKTDIFQLFPTSGSTETLTGTYEKTIDFERIVSVRSIEIMYKLTGVITVKVFDLEIGTSYPVAEVKFFAKTEFDAVTHKMSFRAKKILLQLSMVPVAASNFDWEIDYISLFGESKTLNL